MRQAIHIGLCTHAACLAKGYRCADTRRLALNIGLLLVGGQYFPTLKFLHQGTVYDYDGKRDADSIKAFALVGTPFFHNRSFGYTLIVLFVLSLGKTWPLACRCVCVDSYRCYWVPWYTAFTR